MAFKGGIKFIDLYFFYSLLLAIEWAFKTFSLLFLSSVCPYPPIYGILLASSQVTFQGRAS